MTDLGYSLASLLIRRIPPRAMDSLAHALFARFRSRQDDSFAMRVLAALRNEFGGHAVTTS